MIKRSVSLAIHGPQGAGGAARRAGKAAAIRTPGRSHDRAPDAASSVLLVQRPADDEDLPLAWGLPAASLGEDETWEDAVRRAARDKLGIDVEPGEVLGDGGIERASYTLRMRLYAATITAGEPSVPQPVEGVTQYRAVRWGGPGDLQPAAEAGSLCSRLYLEWAGSPR